MRKLHTEIFTLRVIYPAEASVHICNSIFMPIIPISKINGRFETFQRFEKSFNPY